MTFSGAQSRGLRRLGPLLLTQDGHGYILNGPEALTSREQVEILSDVPGRTIDFVDVTPEQLAQESIDNGTPVQLAGAMQNLTGVAPRTFRDWCGRHVDKFR